MLTSATGLTVVQPPREQPLPSSEAEPETQGPLTGRASRYAPWKCVFAIGVIMLLCLGLVVAAPAPLDQRQASHLPPNCSRFPKFDHMARHEYLPHGEILFDATANACDIVRHCGKKSCSDGEIWRSRDQMADGDESQNFACYEALLATAREYLKLADELEHPADHAVTLHQARIALEEAKRWDTGRFTLDRIEQILLAEVEACSKAAQLADTPTEKLSWLLRAIREMNLPIAMTTGDIPSLSDKKGLCFAEASLWEDVGNILASSTDSKAFHSFKVDGLKLDFVESNEESAAAAFTFAGLYLEAGRFTSIDWQTMSSEFYLQAYEQYQKINDLSDLLARLDIQEKKLQLLYRLRTRVVAHDAISRANVFQEFMTTQQLFGMAAKESSKESTHYKIVQTRHLFNAAEFAPTKEEALKLYQRARNILENLLKRNPAACFTDQVFSSNRLSDWNVEESLLGQLRRKVKEVQDQLKQEGDDFILRSITDFFSKKRLSHQ